MLVDMSKVPVPHVEKFKYSLKLLYVGTRMEPKEFLKLRRSREEEEIEFPEDPDMGYIAGLIDADGAITYAILWQRNKRSVHVQPKLSIGSYHYGFASMMKEYFGGRMYTTKKGFHQVAITNNPVRDWLEILLPYLVLKKKRAELMLEFFESRRIRRYLPYSKEERNLLLDISLRQSKGRPSERNLKWLTHE